MSATDEEGERVDRLRALASRVIERVGGLPAVRTLVATFAVYDEAGGGLVASGLAYAALIALLPGLLLAVSVFGLLVDDPAVRDALVAAIGTAVPPLEDLARGALEQVSAGAVPTGIIAVVGLIWGSSRFYAALDYAFSRVFRNAPRRNEVDRTLRGVLVTALLVALPIAALVIGSVVSWLLDLAPDDMVIEGALRGLWQIATPTGSLILFVVGTAMAYRFVPATRVPSGAYLLPAILVGLALTVFTQVFTFVAPRLVGAAAFYGSVAAVFALLAWLAIGFNVLLMGAAWARVRALALAQPDAPATDPSEPGRGAPGDG
jgi:membrane protein